MADSEIWEVVLFLTHLDGLPLTADFVMEAIMEQEQ